MPNNPLCARCGCDVGSLAHPHHPDLHVEAFHCIAALLAKVRGMEAELKQPKGTFHCPICMRDTPHDHRYLTEPRPRNKSPQAAIHERRWIGVDFDRTLAYDSPNRDDPYELGEPIPEMVNRVKAWLADGYKVKLMTARMHPISFTAGCYRNIPTMEHRLREWCEEYIGQALECTNQKDGLMEVLWDDRAVRVIQDTGSPEFIDAAMLPKDPT